jgi:hypothetical protein
MGLHEGQLSKETSSRYRRFVAAHGERAWELESLTAVRIYDEMGIDIGSAGSCRGCPRGNAGGGAS